MDKEKMIFMSNAASALNSAQLVILNNVMVVDPDAKDREFQLFCVKTVSDLQKAQAQSTELMLKYGSNGALDDKAVE